MSWMGIEAVEPHRQKENGLRLFYPHLRSGKYRVINISLLLIGRSPEGYDSRELVSSQSFGDFPMLIVKAVDMKAGVSRINRLIRLKVLAVHRASKYSEE